MPKVERFVLCLVIFFVNQSISSASARVNVAESILGTYLPKQFVNVEKVYSYFSLWGLVRELHAVGPENKSSTQVEAVPPQIDSINYESRHRGTLVLESFPGPPPSPAALAAFLLQRILHSRNAFQIVFSFLIEIEKFLILNLCICIKVKSHTQENGWMPEV